VTGLFQAVYTAGVTVPTPVASCQYWHRSLNPKKLIEVKFSHLKRGITMNSAIKLYRLPNETATAGLRPLRREDCPQARALLASYLTKFRLFMRFDEAEFEHWFLPRPGVLSAYVVEDATSHAITDLVSFYHLPSTILQHVQHTQLKAAYAWYTVATATSLVQLVRDALVLAARDGFDVFNCLEIQDNRRVLQELKFGAGDGRLQYYLYNWACRPMAPDEVGMVLL